MQGQFKQETECTTVILNSWNVDPKHEIWENEITELNQLLRYQCNKTGDKIEYDPAIMRQQKSIKYDVIHSEILTTIHSVYALRERERERVCVCY